MLRDLAAGQENHGYIKVVTFAQFRVGVDIDFVEPGAKFGEQRGDLRFCFVAQVAVGTRIERHFQRFCGRSIDFGIHAASFPAAERLLG